VKSALLTLSGGSEHRSGCAIQSRMTHFQIFIMRLANRRQAFFYAAA